MCKSIGMTGATGTTGNSAMARFLRAKVTYNYCGICGHQPKTRHDEPNRAPLRWWDPDDGWKIGSLCSGCAEEALEAQPKPTDFAVATHRTNGVCDDVNTDEDPIDAILEAGYGGE